MMTRSVVFRLREVASRLADEKRDKQTSGKQNLLGGGNKRNTDVYWHLLHTHALATYKQNYATNKQKMTLKHKINFKILLDPLSSQV